MALVMGMGVKMCLTSSGALYCFSYVVNCSLDHSVSNLSVAQLVRVKGGDQVEESVVGT